MSTPSYYLLPDGTECRKFIEGMSYYLGTAFAYLWRAGHKPGEPMVKDLRKALDNIRFELERGIGGHTGGKMIEPNAVQVTEEVAKLANLTRKNTRDFENVLFSVVMGDASVKFENKVLHLETAADYLQKLINSLEAQNE